MEPITHFLTGAVLARAGFNRKTALATATMVLAAEAPDLDILWGLKGPVYGFAHHRGFTHSFLGLILVCALVIGFMYLVWRMRGRRTNIPDLPPRWGLLFLFAYIAGLSHILLDFTNNYGVRPFWPFWEKWYSWGVAFIVEPPMLGLLLAGLILPALIGRKPSDRLSGVLLPRLALIMIVALWLVRAYEARGIVDTLKHETFNSETPVRASAFPYWPIPSKEHKGTSLHWSATVETPSFFVLSEAKPFDSAPNNWDKEILPKPAQTPAIAVAENTYLGRVYLDWAQYPYVTEDVAGSAITVDFRNLGFGYPRLSRRTVLSSSVILDKDLHVTGEAVGTSKQLPPID